MTQSAGQLVVIATPIGNLGDLSPRAAEWLQKADILACEDTRMTRKLLTLTGLRTAAKFMPYHDHNGQTMRPKLLDALQSGKMVALVSDAGTPLVSDPVRSPRSRRWPKTSCPWLEMRRTPTSTPQTWKKLRKSATTPWRG